MNEADSRIDRLEAELTSLKTMLVAAVQQVAQRPQREASPDLMAILQKDRTRLRQVAEQLDQLTDLVIHHGEAQEGIVAMVKAVQAAMRELRGGSEAA